MPMMHAGSRDGSEGEASDDEDATDHDSEPEGRWDRS